MTTENKIPTAIEILKSITVHPFPHTSVIEDSTLATEKLIEWCKLHVEAAQKAANEKATKELEHQPYLDSKTIINSYPLDLIK